MAPVWAALATALAILLHWRRDRSLAWLAVAIFGLTVVLLVAGLVLDDTTYIKLSNSIGSLAFAAIIAVGLFARPSLLERTLGHSIQMTERGWSTLHAVWISVSQARAGTNETVWRTASDRTSAVSNGVSDLVWIRPVRPCALLDRRSLPAAARVIPAPATWLEPQGAT